MVGSDKACGACTVALRSVCHENNHLKISAFDTTRMVLPLILLRSLSIGEQSSLTLNRKITQIALQLHISTNPQLNHFPPAICLTLNVIKVVIQQSLLLNVFSWSMSKEMFRKILYQNLVYHFYLMPCVEVSLNIVCVHPRGLWVTSHPVSKLKDSRAATINR